MRKLGLVQVSEDLTLRDPNWELTNNILINVETKEVMVEIVLWEIHAKHNRFKIFRPVEGTVAYNKISDIINIAKARLLTMPEFEGSTE